MSITSYVVPSSKGMKNVLVLSTMHPILGITKDDGKQKPVVFKLYDFTKGGTDQMDQWIGNYSTKTKSSKWTRVAFSYVLETARVNASTVFALSYDLTLQDLDSFELLWKLAESLVLPLAQSRNLNGLSTKTWLKMSLLIGTGNAPAEGETGDSSAVHTPTNRKQRCRMCLKTWQRSQCTSRRNTDYQKSKPAAASARKHVVPSTQLLPAVAALEAKCQAMSCFYLSVSYLWQKQYGQN